MLQKLQGISDLAVSGLLASWLIPPCFHTALVTYVFYVVSPCLLYVAYAW